MTSGTTIQSDLDRTAEMRECGPRVHPTSWFNQARNALTIRTRNRTVVNILARHQLPYSIKNAVDMKHGSILYHLLPSSEVNNVPESCYHWSMCLLAELAHILYHPFFTHLMEKFNIDDFIQLFLLSNIYNIYLYHLKIIMMIKIL